VRLLAAGPIAIAALICCSISSAFAQSVSHNGVRPVGAGAFPLSFTHASAWFGHRADHVEKDLTVLFFFQGKPGWVNQKTDFNWKVNQSPASIEMQVGTVAIRAKYWPETDEVEIQGKKYERSNSNVFLVAGVDEAKPVVTALGTHDLTFDPNDIPPVILLKRDADVWAAVTGHTLGDHPTRQAPSASDEVLGWDKKGLRLLNTEVPEEEHRGCELFRQAAQKGYAPSQYRLGFCYQSGRGVDQSFSEANQWYEKAALQGFVDAEYKLAHSYRTGRGFQIDLPAALGWYKKAAGAGDRDALYNLGWMYATGQGTKVDQQEAYRWFLQSAERGEAGAQFEVARRLEEGEGIGKESVLSYSWMLVLQFQQAKFQPEDWKKVQTLTMGVERQLDGAAKLRALEQSRMWMSAIADAEMVSYSQQ
jgi:hypothetical protein